MTIGIDTRLWNQGGVGRYIRNLCINLAEIDKKNSYVLFVLKQDKAKIGESIKNKNWKIVSADLKWHSFAEQLRLPQIISREKVDLMHFPYFSVPIFYKAPFVVTIHDLIYHHFVSGEASTLPLWLYGFKMLSYRYTIRSATRRAKKIIAVSNFTKRDISNMLGVKGEKIEVIYESADDFKNLPDENIKLENYFLFVGNVYPHKNAGALIEAFKILHKKDSQLHLIFVGSDDFFYKGLKKRFKKMEEEGSVMFLYNVSDQKLASLYKSAICLIRPSLMEGFSLPPLEALSNDCLVLGSDIPAHREILGDSITYFDPYKVDDILSKMKFVLTLPKNEKERIARKGREKAKKFSWIKTAQETLRVYESSLGL